jgi:hypothetical protein
MAQKKGVAATSGHPLFAGQALLSGLHLKGCGRGVMSEEGGSSGKLNLG